MVPTRSDNLAPSPSARAAPLVLRPTPTKPRKGTHPIPDDISDSDDAFSLSPSPPRRLARHHPSPPLPLRLSPSPSVTDDDAQQQRLHADITRAIAASSRSVSVSSSDNLTWHEQILLYDPIVLEDLTAWLNANADVDAVTLPQVKSWCVAMGVCCLRRENLKGEVRRRM
jgi:hypothetical protein